MSVEESKLDESHQAKTKQDRIQVAVRVRPFLNKEYNKDEVVFCDSNVNSIKVSDLTHVVESKYDKVFPQETTQKEIFDFVKPGIETLKSGINCTVFAYGQTGSGKTHTMFGPAWEKSIASQLMNGHTSKNHDFFAKSDNHGLIPRTITEIFKMLHPSMYTIYCSFIQIYNEKLYDLLQDPHIENPLVIREDKMAGIFVEGLTEYVVEKAQDCFILLKRGERNRVTRSTYINASSSRSHSIFQLLIETTKVDANGEFIRAKLNLCDLAGSEKINKDEVMNEQHFEELRTINLSLTTLGKVISALGKKKADSHIPYRDSKITRFLQDSLGGKTKTFLVAAVSPGDDCVEETISTMKFADRAKQVMVRAKANKINGSDDALVKRLQREVQHLRDILSIRRKGGQGELAEQLLALMEENNKLKMKNMELKDVERLKQENVAIKLELQKLMSNNTHQNFHTNQHIDMGDQNSNMFMTEYNGDGKWDDEAERRIDEQDEQDDEYYSKMMFMK